MIRRETRYICFPDNEDGIMGFYQEPTDSKCWRPWYRYEHSEKSWGFCHIRNSNEMNELARRYGAMTKDEYIQERENDGFKTWKNAYKGYLSNHLGNILQEEGILLEIDGKDILFCCPKGFFVPWKGKPGLT